MSDALAVLISELQTKEHGQVIEKSRVVDNLLDLRLAAAPNEAAVVLVDRWLAEAPGNSSVPSEWWVGALEDIRRLTSPELAH